MKQIILIVEDDPGLALTLTDRLESEGFEVVQTYDADTAYSLASEGKFSLVLLDIMLRGKSGFDVCSKLRSDGITTPILMLTAKSQTEDKVSGLKIGADDYLTKPFDYHELLARIEALLRRSSNYSSNNSIIIIGDLFIDIRGAEIKKSGEKIEMTATAFQLLKYLAINRGRLISRDELLNEVWGYEESPTTRTVDTHIGWIRQKIENNPKKPELIVTVHGFGYKMQG